MKLFIVVNEDWFFLSHRKDVALRAQKAGWDVTIVTSDTGKLGEINSMGLRTINLPMNRSGMNIWEEMRTLNWLRKLYMHERPDVVHHVGMKAIMWGTLAAKISKVSGVVNAVSGLGWFFAEENKSLLTRMALKVLKFSHSQTNILCIFQNNEDKDLFVKRGIINSGQARYIKGSGVNLKTFCYTPEPEIDPNRKGFIGRGRINVVLTARMLVEKGVFTLVEAAERLRNKYGNEVQFQLIGGLYDHPGAITKNQLEDVCDGDYITWLGFRTDIRELLGACHIVALPSYYKEGLPKSLIEAAAVGRPIVTCNTVGCRDAVIDGVTGYLIPARDVEALVEKLDLLLSDKTLRIKMGKAGRKYAEGCFDIETVIEKHLSIYNELVK